MEPIEINAGAWYLRVPRADERVDDSPARADLGETDPDYLPRVAVGWADDTGYTWAVCEPLTGELLAEVTLDPVSGQVATRARAGHDDAARTAADTVGRFAAAVLPVDSVSPLAGGPGSTEKNPADAERGRRQ